MRGVAAVVDLLNLVLFTGLALVALRQWRRGQAREGLWAALTFLSLALVVDAGRVLPDEPRGTAELLAAKTLLALLVLYPFLLYRFTAALRRASTRVDLALVALTAAMVIWSFALPRLPVEGEDWPAWFSLYVGAFLVHWAVLSVTVAVRLWRAGRGEPTVARRRMQLIGVASASITIAIFAAAAGGDESTWLELAVGLLATASAVAYLLAIAPPPIVRVLWRGPEQRRLQQAVAHLMTATSEEEVVERVLPPMARIVGARGIRLLDSSGAVVGQHGPDLDESDGYRLETPGGRLLVWRSSYAPFFGDTELATLRSLATLTGLALDRARLFSREQQARRALERADELKTSFVALAAHELRTPVTGIVGIVETLDAHGDELDEGDRRSLERALRRQARHMRALVEQLLDLSKLDADAVQIQPRALEVRGRVEEIVSSTAGRRADDVDVEVPAPLRAEVDHAAFDRIVSNLVANALKYGEPPIVVTAAHRDGQLRVAVEDRGEGVPAELVPSLFERFSRGAGTGGTIGTGLGLAIARAYARAHAGDLVYREAEPHGARFEVVLPAGGPRD